MNQFPGHSIDKAIRGGYSEYSVFKEQKNTVSKTPSPCRIVIIVHMFYICKRTFHIYSMKINSYTSARRKTRQRQS